MNSSPVLVEESGSKRDLAALLGDKLEEPWFSEEPASSRRPSSRPPPSGIVRVGEFLGDPEVDKWLR
jgi:hypothetical protein